MDALCDGWELLDFLPHDPMAESEDVIWEQVADHTDHKPALVSRASPEIFATAVLSAHGSILSVDPNFALWLGNPEMTARLTDMRNMVRLARSGRPSRRLLDDREGRPILVASLERHVALNWPLSEAAKSALIQYEASVCLLAFAPTRSDALHIALKNLFGLTNSEAKLAIALVNHDNLDAAGQAVGITEMTANGYRKQIFKKMNVKRRSELVQIILETGLRERCVDQVEDDSALQTMFGFRPDQMAVLDELARGLTIPEAAAKLDMNLHTARDHVRAMFELVSVKKQSELVRVVLEYRALTALSKASEVNAYAVNDLVAGTRVIARPNGSLIYLGDYGDPHGIPILFFHGGLATRRLPSRFCRLAAVWGLRIICVERPGFGSTDLRAEPGYDGAVLDAEFVLDQLGLSQVIVTSIAGGNIAATSFAATCPSRVRAGLLINPAATPGSKPKTGDPVAGFQQMVLANPALVRTMAKVLQAQMRTDLLDPIIDRYFSTCEADRMAISDPAARTWQRANTQAVLSRTIEGFVREEQAYSTWRMPELACGPWTVAIGLDDHTCDATVARKVWARLPGVKFDEIEQAGRLILLSRPEAVLRCLMDLVETTGRPNRDHLMSAA